MSDPHGSKDSTPQVKSQVKPVAAIYARVSSEGQEDKNGLQRQIHNGQEALAREGCVVPDDLVFTEVQSGADSDRPVFNQILALAKVGAFQVLYLDEVSRMTRAEELYRGLFWVSEFKRFGVRVVIPGLPDPSTPLGQLMIPIQQFASFLEREQIRSRTVPGRLARIPLGLHPSQTPLWGFSYDKTTSKRIPNSELKAITREIFDRTIRGDSLGSIAQWLNSQGYVGGHGKPWSRSQLRHWLQNTALKGQTVYAGKTIDHEGILPAGDWQVIQDRLALQRGRKPSRGKFPLNGFLFCGKCGAKYFAHMGKRYVYANCSRHCGNKTWRYDELEKRAQGLVAFFQDFDNWRRLLLESQGAESSESQYRSIEKEAEKIDRQLRILLAERLSGNFPEGMLAERSHELTARREELERRKLQLASQSSKRLSPADGLKLLSWAHDQWVATIRPGAVKAEVFRFGLSLPPEKWGEELEDLGQLSTLEDWESPEEYEPGGPISREELRRLLTVTGARIGIWEDGTIRASGSWAVGSIKEPSLQPNYDNAPLEIPWSLDLAGEARG